jgi:hypothetical protein
VQASHAHISSGLDLTRPNSLKITSERNIIYFKWPGNLTLQEQYPFLYIARPKYINIVDFLGSSLPTSLRWELIGPKLVARNDLLQHITKSQLAQEQDMFHWSLSGKFSVKLHCQTLINTKIPQN